MTTTCSRLAACCAALLVACSSDNAGGPNHSPQGGMGGALGVRGGAGSASRASTGGSSATSGAGNTSGIMGGGGSAGAASEPDDAMPDYGIPTIEPDTSTEKVADCTGAPDMTLCESSWRGGSCNTDRIQVNHGRAFAAVCSETCFGCRVWGPSASSRTRPPS